MKQSNNKMSDLTFQLNELTQKEMPVDLFTKIQSRVQSEQAKQKDVKKHKFMSLVSIAAVLIMSINFIAQKQNIDQKDMLIQELVKRTVQLEQLLAIETPTITTPGSLITERIVNMESWLEKLDRDIAQAKDKQKVSELMAVKLDILGDLVMLQRKINQKPNYQKLKPYII